jgi:hypothetical protein
VRQSKAHPDCCLKFAQNRRFEIIGFLVLYGAILWFDPRREHSSVPTDSNLAPPRAGPVKAGRVFRGHPKGPGLDWPEHGGILDRIGAEGAATS